MAGAGCLLHVDLVNNLGLCEHQDIIVALKRLAVVLEPLPCVGMMAKQIKQCKYGMFWVASVLII